jgi:hypothetical protein
MIDDEIDPRRLGERIEWELGRLLEGRSFAAPISIDRVEIGPLDEGLGTDDLARAIAAGVAQAIPGGAHGKTET